MRFIPTVMHGIADYIVGLVTIGLPFYLDINGMPGAVVTAMGVIVLIYSVVTDYELGVVRFLRIRFHLVLDALFGFAMLSVPLVFDLPGNTSWPFYAIGVLAIVLVAITEIRATGTATE